MGVGRPRVLGRTLVSGKGFPHANLTALGYTARRAGLTLLAVAGFVAGMTATAAAIEGNAISGAVTEDPGGSVVSVSPVGFAWKDGIRAGQTVRALDDTQSPDGWRIETVDAVGVIHTSRASTFDASLSSSWPFGAAATGAGVLALVFVRTHRRWVAPFAGLALYFAGAPLEAQGDPLLSTFVLASAAVVPIGSLLQHVPHLILRLLAGAAVAGFVVVWAVNRLTLDPAANGLEPVRALIAGYGTAGIVIGATVVPFLLGERAELTRPRLTDLLAVSLFGALAAVLVFVVEFPPILAFVGLAGAMLVLPWTRRFVSRRIEAGLFGDMRAGLMLDASEAERARLARELHDAPLQELTSVIHHLALIPEARAETERLRSVAQQLRETATNLRPPVLDDLGLAAALDFLASETTSSGVEVEVDVHDEGASSMPARPPGDVELAVFRIAQEAVTNALRHANCSHIAITGEISPDAVVVAIQDNGSGMSRERERDAARAGRLGLASMRRRAEAIDADLSIDGAGPGTTISVRWQR